jgi:hypothetical protein
LNNAWEPSWGGCSGKVESFCASLGGVLLGDALGPPEPRAWATSPESARRDPPSGSSNRWPEAIRLASWPTPLAAHCGSCSHPRSDHAQGETVSQGHPVSQENPSEWRRSLRALLPTQGESWFAIPPQTACWGPGNCNRHWSDWRAKALQRGSPAWRLETHCAWCDQVSTRAMTWGTARMPRGFKPSHQRCSSLAGEGKSMGMKRW